ncbi:MAG TPA: M48 family metallopeptidase [Patescibacteria group bacterium]|nr:M48 family metallopeptidase [Patescibacteria group bacterium]
MKKYPLLVVLLVVLAVSAVGPLTAQPQISGSAQTFNPEKATNAYLASLSPEARAKSAAYWNGGYWIQLIDLAVALAIAWLLLASGISRRMRELAEGLSRRKPLQTFFYGVQYFVAVFILSFPATYYAEFVREHRFGLSHQPFGQWLGEQFIALAVSAILISLFFVAVYGLVRKKAKTWWLWGSAATVLFLAFILLIAPVFIDPLFNTYKPMDEGPLKERILNLARGNGIPANDVFQFDASRQTTRISANVSGIFGTMRIALNDNLLKRCTPGEVEVVMAHEMGHYVLNHIYEILVYFALVVLAGFVFLYWASNRLLHWRGSRWGIRDTGDPAGLPLLMFLFILFMFLASPLVNNIIRSNEVEADIFSLNVVRQPEAWATLVLKLSEYRKLDPSPLEEWLFYDHPSGRNRILMGMRWKQAFAKQ